MKIRSCRKCNHVFNSDKFDKCPKCQTPWDLGKGGNTMILRREAALETESKKKEKTIPFLACEESEGSKVMVSKPEFIIGRSKEADLFYNDAKISRQHAKILLEDEEYYLVDLRSTNGTFLNDKKIEPNKKNRLISGDIVIFHKHRCIFYKE